MEILFLLAIVLVLFVPQFLLTRKQKAAQQRILNFQASLEPGQRVITAGGFHVTVIEVDETTILAEFSPGQVFTLERSAVMRLAEEETIVEDLEDSEDSEDLVEPAQSAQPQPAQAESEEPADFTEPAEPAEPGTPIQHQDPESGEVKEDAPKNLDHTDSGEQNK